MKKPWVIAARFMGMGWYVGFCIAGGFFSGRWIGQKLESEAFFRLLGLGVGLLLAAYGIYASFSLLSKEGIEDDEHNGR